MWSGLRTRLCLTFRRKVNIVSPCVVCRFGDPLPPVNSVPAERALLLCSVCLVMGRWKDIFPLGEANNFRFVAVRKRKEAHASGGRAGSRRAPFFPQLTRWDVRKSPAVAESHCLRLWAPLKRISTDLVQSSWQLSRQISSTPRTLNPSLKAQISMVDLCHSKSA